MVGACPFPAPQGSQVLLADTSRALADRGHEVHLVAYGFGKGDTDINVPLHRSRRIPGAKKTSAGPSLAKPFLDGALVTTLRQVMRRYDLEIVHAHNYEGLLVALASRKRPIVYHAHNAMADELPFYFSKARWAAGVGRLLDRTVPHRADAVIAPHHALAEYLIAAGCPASKVHVIPPSAGLDAFSVQPASKGLPIMLYTGNLDAYQNLDFLTAVYGQVRQSLPEMRFVIGTAASSEAPDAEVVVTDNIGALQRLLAQDAVFVCPRTSWSGYPIKLLNAMASGKAIVASRSSSHGLEHESSALIVDDHDVEGFAAAVCRLAQEPRMRDSLGAQARKAAETRHAPDVIAQQIERVYAQVACLI